MKTNSQNRPYLATSLPVRAEFTNRETKLVRVLVFDWNDREAVRRFAEQGDQLLRAGHTSCLAPFGADHPRRWLVDVLDMSEGATVGAVTTVTAIVTYEMKQRALGLLKRAAPDPIAKWIFRLFQQPASPDEYVFGTYQARILLSPELEDAAITLLDV